MGEQFKLNLVGGGKKLLTNETVHETDPNADLKGFSPDELKREKERLLEMKQRFISSEPDTIQWVNERLDAIAALE